MIECVQVFCEEPATTGGIFRVQPNGLAPTHAVYYACATHPDALETALETWPVRRPEALDREGAPDAS